MNKSIEDTACSLAWDYPVLNFADTGLRYCCRSSPNFLSDDDIDKGVEIFNNNDYIKAIRKDLLTGVKSPSCGACWVIESQGGWGPRTRLKGLAKMLKSCNFWSGFSLEQVTDRLLNLSENDIEELIKLELPRMIEISLGNTCDLKCTYCNHHYSSQWAVERFKYGEIDQNTFDKLSHKNTNNRYEDIWWNWFEKTASHHANWINFIGGEPLIMEKFYTYVDRVIDIYEKPIYGCQPRVISVISNFNTPEKFYQKFMSTTSRILDSKSITLDMNVSCESIGDRAAFIRYGTNWDIILGHIDKLFNFVKDNNISNTRPDTKPFMFGFQMALNTLCISDLPNFFKWVVELQKNWTSIPIGLRQNQVAYPNWMNPNILPSEYASYIDESIDILSSNLGLVDDTLRHDFGKWSMYIKFLQTIRNGIYNPVKDQSAQKLFAINIDTLCNRRNLDFASTFPEMLPFYNSYAKKPACSLDARMNW